MCYGNTKMALKFKWNSSVKHFMKVSSVHLNIIYLTQNEAVLLITWWSLIQTHKRITIWKRTAARNKCTGTEMRIPLWTQCTPKKTHPTTAEVNNNVPWLSHLQNCCHQVFQLLTLALHTLGWYLACWHKNRDAGVTKFSSCWHLCSTHLAGTLPVDTKTDAAVTKFSSCWHLRSTHLAGTLPVDTKTDVAVTKFSSCWHLRSTCFAGTLPVDTKTEMLLSSSFSAVNTCAPHAWCSNSSKCQTTQIISGISFITIHLPNLVLTKILPGHPPHNTHIYIEMQTRHKDDSSIPSTKSVMEGQKDHKQFCFTPTCYAEHK